MNRRNTVTATFPLLLVALSAVARAEPRTATIDVDVDKPGNKIPPTFYGFMTEEINHSYDGGLFAELVQNRTFQDPLPQKRGKPIEAPPPADPPTHWTVVGDGKMATDKADPVNPALPISLRLDLTGGKGGIANDGYWGVPVRPDTEYQGAFYAKGGNGFAGPVTASLVSDDGSETFATVDTAPVTGRWAKYEFKFRTGHDAPTTAKAKFVVGATGTGAVTFSMVSLFPPTYGDIKGGLRPDLMKLMADLHPAFIRLPGGNYLEGDYFSSRFDWKKEIGPADQRPGHMGCWNYRSSDGFGLPQYLLWCKQLNAEPVLAVFAGYVLQHQSVAADSPQMKQYVQEALEEIEYVAGPADSEWGAKRAADGFQDPFKLHYVEIGNEDWFDPKKGGYDARYTVMADAIRAKYPQLKLIATAPIHQNHNVDLYDDHYYRSAAVMAGDADHYDADRTGQQRFSGGHHDGAFPRTGPQIFVGEWATREGKVTSTLTAALADACWMMGMERNADLIPIQCYAPLLVNVNPGAWQWKIDLIGFDAMTSFGSAAFHAQAMFSQNQGDTVLPTKLSAPKVVAGTEPAPHGEVGVGTWHTTAEYKDITVTAPDGQQLMKADFTGGDTKGWLFTGDKWAIANGGLKPSAVDTETWGITGDPKWTNYTLRLKARKTGGNEGFLILFHAVDSENFVWWNVGGWTNTKSQLSARVEGSGTEFGKPSNFKVDAGKWYDLRVEVDGNHFKCYADDRLVNEATLGAERISQPLLATATYITPTHEVVVKAVNMGNDAVDATINLNGIGAVSAGKAWVLTGQPKDENTIDQPTKVAPKEEAVTDVGPTLKRTLPAHSLTLIRLPVTGK
jgi:alpha-L-arabinofuranosidase